MKRAMLSIRTGLAAIALALFAIGAAPALAQPSPTGSNPTANSVNEEMLFKQSPKIGGRITIPDDKAANLIQPQGRDWRGFHEGALPWIGGIAILGMVLALGAFYFTKGRIRMEDSPESGTKIVRFNAFERFAHWLTSTTFIILAISGLNYIFGKYLLLPIIGPSAFASFSQWSKYAHNYLHGPSCSASCS
jgi:formate dehydrogenase subunit gamma